MQSLGHRIYLEISITIAKDQRLYMAWYSL